MLTNEPYCKVLPLRLLAPDLKRGAGHYSCRDSLPRAIRCVFITGGIVIMQACDYSFLITLFGLEPETLWLAARKTHLSFDFYNTYLCSLICDGGMWQQDEATSRTVLESHKRRSGWVKGVTKEQDESPACLHFFHSSSHCSRLLLHTFQTMQSTSQTSLYSSFRLIRTRGEIYRLNQSYHYRGIASFPVNFLHSFSIISLN